MAVTVDRASLRQFFDNPIGPVGLHLVRTSQRVESRARQLAGVRSGQLANKISQSVSRDANGLVATVLADVPYAAAHHEGAAPRRIFPRQANALHFFWTRRGGIETFVPKRPIRGGGSFISNGILIIGKGFVNWPGHRSNSFLMRAAAEVIGGGR